MQAGSFITLPIQMVKWLVRGQMLAITVMIYRRPRPTWTAPVVYTNNGTGTTVTYAESSYYGPYFRPRWNNTESWMLRFAGHSAATDLASTTPSGWTARGWCRGMRSMDSGGVVSTKSSTSIGDNTQTVNTSGNWITMTVQVEIWNGTGIVCMSANTSTLARHRSICFLCRVILIDYYQQAWQ